MNLTPHVYPLSLELSKLEENIIERCIFLIEITIPEYFLGVTMDKH